MFLNPKLVKTVLVLAGGKVFTVIFQKKNDQIRIMNARRGVRKFLKGGESTIKNKPDLIGVYDIGKKDYRSFDSTRVLAIKANGAVIVSAKLLKS